MVPKLSLKYIDNFCKNNTPPIKNLYFHLIYLHNQHKNKKMNLMTVRYL